jgi:hypothetical protein
MSSYLADTIWRRVLASSSKRNATLGILIALTLTLFSVRMSLGSDAGILTRRNSAFKVDGMLDASPHRLSAAEHTSIQASINAPDLREADDLASPEAAGPAAAAAAPRSYAAPAGPLSVRDAVGTMLESKPAPVDTKTPVIIRTGSMRAVIPVSVDAVVNAAEAALARLGGYVERARIQRNEGVVRAYAAVGIAVNGSTAAELTLRVPVRSFDELRGRLRAIVAGAGAQARLGARPPRVEADDVDAEDATAEHADLATRLAVELASLAQMEALLRAVSNISEALLVKAQVRRGEAIEALYELLVTGGQGRRAHAWV